jgi:hypothetical protein
MVPESIESFVSGPQLKYNDLVFMDEMVLAVILANFLGTAAVILLFGAL